MTAVDRCCSLTANQSDYGFFVVCVSGHLLDICNLFFTRSNLPQLPARGSAVRYGSGVGQVVNKFYAYDLAIQSAAGGINH